MEETVTTTTQQVLDIVFQLLIIVVPILLTWFLRNYVRGTTQERDLAAIVRLSNSAIDYVENLDSRDALNLPEGASKGLHKLNVAGNWMEEELNRAGIGMTTEDAQKWITAEFQKRMGEVRMVGKIGQLAKTAVLAMQQLDQNKLIDFPPAVDRLTYLADMGTDWVVAELAKSGASISREEALTWVRAAMIEQLREQVDMLPQNAVTDSVKAALDELPPNEQLAELARQAVAFLTTLKANNRLTIQPGNQKSSDVDLNVSMAWLLAEATKNGLEVTLDDVYDTISVAMETA